MAPPLSRAGMIAVVHREKLRKARRARLAKALRRFRSRKVERRSFVFLTPRGARTAGKGRRKVFIVYVNQLGRAVPVRSRLRAEFRPQKVRSYDLFKTRKKTALRKVYGKRLTAIHLSGMTFARVENPLTHKVEQVPIRTLKQSRKEKATGIDYRRLGKQFGKDAACFYRTRVPEQQRPVLTVQGHGSLKTKAGKRIPFRMSEALSQAQVTNLKKGDARFAQKLLWKYVSRELAMNDLVTSGSRQHIQRLTGNKGKSKSQWKDGRGRLWGKSNYEVVKLERFDYSLQRVD